MKMDGGKKRPRVRGPQQKVEDRGLIDPGSMEKNTDILGTGNMQEVLDLLWRSEDAIQSRSGK